MESPVVLGLDIGGSHISAALVDTETRTLITHSIHRKLVDSQGTANSILNAWCEVIVDSYTGYEAQTKQIGIAMPGPFDYENGICLIKDQDKFRALYQLNLKEELAGRLAISPSSISFINDAASFLQGEIFAGNEQIDKLALGFTLGTGLGSAICINGIARDAALWSAPFLDSIAEDYLSTKWFVKRYFELTGAAIKGVKELADVVATDENVQQIFMEFGYNFAQFMIPIVKEHQIELIILGGNIAYAYDLFSPSLSNALEQNQLLIEIKTSKLKEHAALIGAASCIKSDIKV